MIMLKINVKCYELSNVGSSAIGPIRTEEAYIKRRNTREFEHFEERIIIACDIIFILKTICLTLR